MGSLGVSMAATRTCRSSGHRGCSPDPVDQGIGTPSIEGQKFRDARRRVPSMDEADLSWISTVSSAARPTAQTHSGLSAISCHTRTALSTRCWKESVTDITATKLETEKE